MPRTFRKIFTQAELQHVLGERVLTLHQQNPDGREYDITIMPVPGTEDANQYQIRVEVTEKPHARGTTCGED